MSRYDWTRRQSGDDRITLRVRFDLSADDLARALAWGCKVYGVDITGATAATVRDEVIDLLASNGKTCMVDVEPDDDHREAIRRAFGAP